jgi:hypothetical protein
MMESASNLAMPPWRGTEIARASGASHSAGRSRMGKLAIQKTQFSTAQAAAMTTKIAA